MDNRSHDGLAIPDGRRAGSERGWHERLSSAFAYTSLICSLSFWASFALYYLQNALHFSLPAQKWFDSLSPLAWLKLQILSVLLAVIAAILNYFGKLWRIALPLSILMFLFIMYVMGS